MAVCYDKLSYLMIDRKITNSQLKEKVGFSPNIITRQKRTNTFHWIALNESVKYWMVVLMISLNLIFLH